VLPDVRNTSANSYKVSLPMVKLQSRAASGTVLRSAGQNMQTLALKELEDQTWFPELLRNHQTDFVGFASNVLHAYAPFADYLKAKNIRAEIMKDLCAGSGAPAIFVFRRSGQFRHLLLTDKFPRRLHNDKPDVSYSQQSTDVLKMFFSPGVCYTMFNAFHHFTDVEKQQLVKRMTVAGSRAYCVEILEPTWFCLLKILLLTTFGTLLLTPFIRPFSWSRLFFTYVIPLNVISIAFDGIVSVRRARSVSHYKELLSAFSNVNVFTLKYGLGSATVIEVQPHA
jgi:hypothetical protein